MNVVGHVVAVSAVAVAKSKALSEAAGAGLGVVAAASVGPDDKDTRAENLTDKDVTGKMKLVRGSSQAVDAGEVLLA